MGEGFASQGALGSAADLSGATLPTAALRGSGRTGVRPPRGPRSWIAIPSTRRTLRREFLRGTRDLFRPDDRMRYNWRMRVLGIETSCDETAAAVVDGATNLLSNVVLSQVAVHAPFKGVVPELASRNHVEAIYPVAQAALEGAGIQVADLDGIAVTIGPGLIGSLLVGVEFAKGLALGLGVPIVGVNHVHAHLMAAFLCDSPPGFPFVGLVVSGGHTSLYLVRGFGDLELLGRTLDDACGEAFDKAALAMGLSYPGGPAIARAAEGGDPRFVEFPRPMLHSQNLDFSFSGLKTALLRVLQGVESSPELLGHVAASFQEAVVEVLVAKTLRAVDREGVDWVVLAGGVAANARLRERMRRACEQRGVTLVAVPLEFCTDNAAMIASLGYRYLFGELADNDAPRGFQMDPFERHVLDGC